MKGPDQWRGRALLAAFFRVDEEVLGGPPARGSAMVQVARLDFEASAGPYGFDSAWLRAVTSAKPADLSIIRVRGDSMVPTLIDGDDALVDQSVAGRIPTDGIFVLRRDETLMVKRLAIAPTAATLTILSDNPAYRGGSANLDRLLSGVSA